ncbi:MAG: HAMP domain-containing protein [Dehalococcoidia bacterium]|nr:MAG: HAMP domain-containing protein [Dehalococcoidia bacterium]
MRIRTQLIIIFALLCITLAVITGSYLITARQLGRVREQRAVVANIVMNVAELRYLSGDFLLHQESQILARWEVKFAEFSAEVAKLKPADTREQLLRDNVADGEKRLAAVFGDAVAALETIPAPGDAADLTLITTFWSRTEVQNQELAFNASSLSRLLDTEENQLLATDNITRLSTLTAFGMFLLLTYAVTYRRTLRAISRLQAATRVVASGNLNYAIKVERADEIGDLVRAFNQMTVSLQETTARRETLEREITSRKKFEEALSRNEQELATILASIPSLLLVVDSERRLLKINTATAQFTDRSIDEILGLRAGEGLGCLNSMEDPRGCGFGTVCQLCVGRQTILDTYETGTSHYQVEWQLTNSLNGKEEELTFLLSTILLGTSPKRVLVCLDNITERKKADLEISHLASFPELNPNPVIELDEHGNIEYLNPAAARHFLDALEKGEQHPFLANWESLAGELRSGRDAISRDVRVGEQWYEQLVTYVPPKRRFRIYAVEITGRKKAEQMKDEFLSLVSHELRTPLTVISGSLRTAQSPGISPEDRELLIQNAIEGTGMLSAILENMLELSRYQAGRLNLRREPLRVPDIAARVVADLRSLGEDRQFVLEFPADLPLVGADPVRVERILFNLVQNAAKYSPDGSEIKVSTRRDGDSVVTAVTDRGRGISPQQQGRLFELFERLGRDASSQGLGLGLVVCKRLVEAQGGCIWTESEPGKGSTFYFTLPVLDKR